MMDQHIHSLSWGSSQVDWCEGNFKITAFVAEFWNTVSNVLFFVFPPLLIHLFRQYARQVSQGVNVVWVLLVVVGLGSVYFHATLSLVGQLLDEVAIIWVFMAALALWFPRRYMPEVFQQNRALFRRFMMVCTVLSTGLACVMPAINCVVLLFLGIPATTLLLLELKHCDDSRVFQLGVRCCMTWVVALSSWLSDRVFCALWEHIGFPYMHCMWHIFICLATYQACVLFAYFTARVEVPEQMPVIQYWPRDTWNFWGIPFVKLKCFSHKPTYKVY